MRYLRRRFPPAAGRRLPTLAEHLVVRGDRLDLIAAAYLGDPTQFWRICDANPVIHPEELTSDDRIGRTIRIPVPRAVRRPRWPSLSTTLTLLIGPTVAGAGAAGAARRPGAGRGDHLRQRPVRLPARLLRGPVGIRRPGRLLPARPADSSRPFNRVVLMVTFGGPPTGADGRRDHAPRADARRPPGTGTLTVTGEDVSVMMDLEERIAEHTAQAEASIATALIGRYADVRPGPAGDAALRPVDRPPRIERIPVQRGTDLAYLNEMATPVRLRLLRGPRPRRR